MDISNFPDVAVQRVSEDSMFYKHAARLTKDRVIKNTKFEAGVLEVRFGTANRGRTLYIAKINILARHQTLPDFIEIVGQILFDELREKADADANERAARKQAKTVSITSSNTSRDFRAGLKSSGNAIIDGARKAARPQIKSRIDAIAERNIQLIHKMLVAKGFATEETVIPMVDNDEANDDIDAAPKDYFGRSRRRSSIRSRDLVRTPPNDDDNASLGSNATPPNDENDSLGSNVIRDLNATVGDLIVAARCDSNDANGVEQSDPPQSNVPPQSKDSISYPKGSYVDVDNYQDFDSDSPVSNRTLERSKIPKVTVKKEKIET